MSSALYRGSLVHTRRDHLRRTFRYPVFMAALDLGEIATLDDRLRLFSFGRPNLFSLYTHDYSTSLDVADHAGTHEHITSTTLITNLRFAGYAFNPVSFFLRYAGEDLVSVIAEVNNTYGGRHCYVLDASNREQPETERIGFSTTRELFVSPFLHGPRVYEWWFPSKRDPARLAITMHVGAPRLDAQRGSSSGSERMFTATVAGDRHALTDRALVGAAVRYPLNTAQVIGLIHYEAMKLRFLHREPYRRPGPDHRPLDHRAGSRPR